MCIGVGVSSLSLFAPTIVSGLGYKNLQAQLFTIPPYAVAYVVTLVLAMISDHKKTRGLVAGGCFLFGTIAFIIQGESPSLLVIFPKTEAHISFYSLFAGQAICRPLCHALHQHRWRLCWSSSVVRLDLRQCANYHCGISSHGTQHCLYGARSDYWSLDLSGARCAILSPGPWHQRWFPCRGDGAELFFVVALHATE